MKMNHRPAECSALLLISVSVFATIALPVFGGVRRHDVPDSEFVSLATNFPSVGQFVRASSGETFASGTLIAPDVVLTAAHVVDAIQGLPFGDWAVFKIGNEELVVLDGVQHDNWDGDSEDGFDIAIVRLTNPANEVSPATLYFGEQEVGATATLVGFGRTGTGLTGEQPNTSGSKRAGQNRIDAAGYTFSILGIPSTYSDKILFCDFDNPDNPNDSYFDPKTPVALEFLLAHGDSGGGLFIDIAGQRELAGVHSFTRCGEWLCPEPNSDYGDIGGATRVSSHRDWILAAMDRLTVTVAVRSSPEAVGLKVNVDGVDVTDEQTFTWNRQSSHTLQASLVQSGNDGKQYLFQNWEDGNTASTRIVNPLSDAAFTAIYATSSGETVTLAPNADTMVAEQSPDVNYGFSQFLIVSRSTSALGRRDSLVRFSLSSIPSGSTVDQVELKLTVTGATTTDVFEISKALGSWSETAVKWNNRPSPSTPFALMRADTSMVSIKSSDFPGLKTAIQDYVKNPGQNYGFYIAMNSGSDGFSFYSREETTTSRRPALVVTYRPPIDTQGDSITVLSAKTSGSGSAIGANTWQRDDDPYFYWNEPASVSAILGYSHSLDATPDDTIDTTVAYVQYASGSLANGTHTFYVKAKDAAGNWGPAASFVIKVDDIPPVNGTIAINSGVESTGSLIVSLDNLGAIDQGSGLSQMRFSNDDNTWSLWETYASSRGGWDMSNYGGTPAAGEKTVFVQLRDAAGNIATFQDTITYNPIVSRFTSVSRQGGEIVLEWVGVGTLQETTATGWPWTWVDVLNPTNPLVINSTSARKFYRLRIGGDHTPLTADLNTLALYHFDEASGDALDASGNGLTGALQNGATRIESAPGLGTALLLDGTDDFVTIEANLLNNRPAGTIEALLYLPAYQPNGSAIVSKGRVGLTDCTLFVGADGRVSGGNMGMSALTLTGNTPVPLNTWTRVAFSWDGNFWRIYVNGQLDAQLASTLVPATSSNPVMLGHHNHSSISFYFAGRIDEVRFSNIARSFP